PVGKLGTLDGRPHACHPRNRLRWLYSPRVPERHAVHVTPSLLPRSSERTVLFARSCHFIPSLCRWFMPSLDRLHRYLQRRIDFSVDRFRSGALANLQHLTFFGGQHHCDDLVRAQLFAQGPPGGVHTAIQEALLDGYQQMVGQDTEEDMRLRALFQMMEDGPLQ